MVNVSLGGRSVITPELEDALLHEDEILITTYDTDNKPGTVPIWFVYTEGKVYVATGRNSAKTLKLQTNPRVRLSFAGNKNRAIEGKGRICTEKMLVARVAPILNQKYRQAWGPDTRMVERLLEGDIVLIEVTP